MTLNLKLISKFFSMRHILALGSDAWSDMLRRDWEMLSVVCGSFMIMSEFCSYWRQCDGISEKCKSSPNPVQSNPNCKRPGTLLLIPKSGFLIKGAEKSPQYMQF